MGGTISDREGKRDKERNKEKLRTIMMLMMLLLLLMPLLIRLMLLFLLLLLQSPVKNIIALASPILLAAALHESLFLLAVAEVSL
jgi:hypothetical protein